MPSLPAALHHLGTSPPPPWLVSSHAPPSQAGTAGPQLAAALEASQQVALSVNATKLAAAQSVRVLEIFELLGGSLGAAPDLPAPHRLFLGDGEGVCRGQRSATKKKRPHTLWVFSDCLLIARLTAGGTRGQWRGSRGAGDAWRRPPLRCGRGWDGAGGGGVCEPGHSLTRRGGSVHVTRGCRCGLCARGARLLSRLSHPSARPAPFASLSPPGYLKARFGFRHLVVTATDATTLCFTTQGTKGEAGRWSCVCATAAAARQLLELICGATAAFQSRLRRDSEPAPALDATWVVVGT